MTSVSRPRVPDAVRQAGGLVGYGRRAFPIDGDLLSDPVQYVETTPVPGPRWDDRRLGVDGWGRLSRRVDKGGAFESDRNQTEGKRIEHTFEDSVVYKYVCTPHETVGMKGVVVS